MSRREYRKVVFFKGTRADFGKLKSLINILEADDKFEVFVFITGMHLLEVYGSTYKEVERCNYKNVYKYLNYENDDSMDQILARTVLGFSEFIRKDKPDMIVVHGDRVEALAGAIVGSMNNILVSHIEGGEVSGTIDEMIRHAVTKMAHLHFVSNDEAKTRAIQLGEPDDKIFTIGSPDMDVMCSKNLPDFNVVRKYYDIPFESYGILLFHPVTTEYECLKENVTQLVNAILKSEDNYIVVFPNNDHGSEIILTEYKRFDEALNVKVYPSVRFEYFLILLKYAKFIVGNSSAGIREAPFYGVPTINIGSRQQNRASADSIVNCDFDESSIVKNITKARKLNCLPTSMFGAGQSDVKFKQVLEEVDVWNTNSQKYFVDIKNLMDH